MSLLFIILFSFTTVFKAYAPPITLLNSGGKEIRKEEQEIKRGGDRPTYKEGELLIKFKEDVASEEMASVLSKHHLEIIKKMDEIGVYHVKITDDTPVPQKITELRESKAVKYAEPVYIVSPL